MHSNTLKRFWTKVNRSGDWDSCWEWTGAKDPAGYGRFRFEGRAVLAHRFAFVLAGGAPDTEAVCHTCDNPSCCNPTHLVAGTREWNNRDMTEKRRHWSFVNPEAAVRGEKHGSAKLTEDDVRSIRRHYRTGGFTQYELADLYNVSQRTINKVVNKTGWSHVQ